MAQGCTPAGATPPTVQQQPGGGLLDQVDAGRAGERSAHQCDCPHCQAHWGGGSAGGAGDPGSSPWAAPAAGSRCLDVGTAPDLGAQVTQLPRRRCRIATAVRM